jgi:hypothetical protein
MALSDSNSGVVVGSSRWFAPVSHRGETEDTAPYITRGKNRSRRICGTFDTACTSARSCYLNIYR